MAPPNLEVPQGSSRWSVLIGFEADVTLGIEKCQWHWNRLSEHTAFSSTDLGWENNSNSNNCSCFTSFFLPRIILSPSHVLIHGPSQQPMRKIRVLSVFYRSRKLRVHTRNLANCQEWKRDLNPSLPENLHSSLLFSMGLVIPLLLRYCRPWIWARLSTHLRDVWASWQYILP